MYVSKKKTILPQGHVPIFFICFDYLLFTLDQIFTTFQLFEGEEKIKKRKNVQNFKTLGPEI